MVKITPKLNITYSFVYDQMIHQWRGMQYTRKTHDTAVKFTAKLKKEISRSEKKIVNAISEASCLKWQKKEINCYVVTRSRPFSDPITLPVRKDAKQLVETIMHELVHNICMQNKGRLKMASLKKKHKNLPAKIQIHILIHAILKEALLKLYSKQKVAAHIKRYGKMPDYKLAWDIVEQDGSKNIIKEFIR